MRSLKRIVSLTTVERQLLVRALPIVALARMAIWILPFASARRFVDRCTPRMGPHSPENLAWAVTVASRVVPFATCLVQALAAEALLIRAGHKPRIEVGVRREPPDGFEAHAWVTVEDRIVLGGGSVSRFARLGPGGL